MARSFGKVLVANRGEIAWRVFAGCRDLGLATVAIHSDADARSVRRGGRRGRSARGDCRRRYLPGHRRGARGGATTGADAIHPGYGFLAENADFAARVADAGLVWIGPPPTAIEAMGSKVRARA